MSRILLSMRLPASLFLLSCMRLIIAKLSIIIRLCPTRSHTLPHTHTHTQVKQTSFVGKLRGLYFRHASSQGLLFFPVVPGEVVVLIAVVARQLCQIIRSDKELSFLLCAIKAAFGADRKQFKSLSHDSPTKPNGVNVSLSLSLSLSGVVCSQSCANRKTRLIVRLQVAQKRQQKEQQQKVE